MQFTSIFALAIAALAFVVADSEVKHKPHHRHSSSSSDNCGCACTEAEAIKEVKRMQKAVETALITDSAATFDLLTTTDFSYSLNVRGCQTQCCVTLGDKSGFMSVYDNNFVLLEFLYNQPNYIKRYQNGTIVVSKTQIMVPVQGDSYDLHLNFHYNPTSFRGCEFKLAYVDGNALGCPTFQSNLFHCLLCEV